MPRFMGFVKMEEGIGAPPQALFDAMNDYIGEQAGKAVFLDGGGLVGALTRMTRDVQLAEDLAQDALLAALEQWPTAGVPTNPAAWLMTTARRRSVDHFRRAERLRRKTDELGQAQMREEGEQMPDL